MGWTMDMEGVEVEVDVCIAAQLFIFFRHTLHPPPPLAPSHAFLRVGISWRGGSPSILVSFR